MDIIFSASIIAAFLAGMVALFAPCCITVLLPSYLASAFQEKKNIFRMTLLFFLGIAVILVPIGLGAAGFARIFRDFHKEMYIFGGLLMVVFAVLAVSGKGLSIIPMPKRLTPRMDGANSKSVFLLGMFSGAATSCCAPVLAGAVTLAVISGTFWKALIVTFAYVFGMTFPLFITAYVYDKYKIENSRLIKGKLFEMNLGSKKFYVHSTNILSGAIFLVMGIILLIMAFSGNTFWAPSFQVGIGEKLNTWSQIVFEQISVIPESIWGIVIIGVFFYFVYKAYSRAKLARKENGTKNNRGENDRAGTDGSESGDCCSKKDNNQR
ncbi:MAG: cytochrome c biogenesis CcdA family protein [Parcubacteria group bacterium]